MFFHIMYLILVILNHLRSVHLICGPSKWILINNTGVKIKQRAIWIMIKRDASKLLLVITHTFLNSTFYTLFTFCSAHWSCFKQFCQKIAVGKYKVKSLRWKSLKMFDMIFSLLPFFPQRF